MNFSQNDLLVGIGEDALRNIQKLISRSQAMDPDTFFKKLEEEIEKLASTANTDNRRVCQMIKTENN